MVYKHITEFDKRLIEKEQAEREKEEFIDLIIKERDELRKKVKNMENIIRYQHDIIVEIEKKSNESKREKVEGDKIIEQKNISFNKLQEEKATLEKKLQETINSIELLKKPGKLTFKDVEGMEELVKTRMVERILLNLGFPCQDHEAVEKEIGFFWFFNLLDIAKDYSRFLAGKHKDKEKIEKIYRVVSCLKDFINKSSEFSYAFLSTIINDLNISCKEIQINMPSFITVLDGLKKLGYLEDEGQVNDIKTKINFEFEKIQNDLASIALKEKLEEVEPVATETEEKIPIITPAEREIKAEPIRIEEKKMKRIELSVPYEKMQKLQKHHDCYIMFLLLKERKEIITRGELVRLFNEMTHKDLKSTAIVDIFKKASKITAYLQPARVDGKTINKKMFFLYVRKEGKKSIYCYKNWLDVK
jgi:hypothetical protein